MNYDTQLEMEIQESLDLPSDNPINGDLTAAELELFLRHQKSKAVGLDLVHNEMLFLLSTENRESLLNIFNLFWRNSFVPDHW